MKITLHQLRGAHRAAKWANHQWGQIDPHHLEQLFPPSGEWPGTSEELRTSIIQLVTTHTEPGIMGWGLMAPKISGHLVTVPVGEALRLVTTPERMVGLYLPPSAEPPAVAWEASVVAGTRCVVGAAPDRPRDNVRCLAILGTAIGVDELESWIRYILDANRAEVDERYMRLVQNPGHLLAGPLPAEVVA